MTYSVPIGRFAKKIITGEFMKTFIFLLALASSNLFASTDLIKTCSKQFGEDVVTSQLSNMSLVGKYCLIEDYITKSSIDMKVVNEFLELEKEIGEESYDVHHVNELFIYKASYAHMLNQRNIDYMHLQKLADFSINSLGIYTPEELYGDDGFRFWSYLDIMRYAEVVTKEKLTKELSNFFGEKVIEPYEDDMTEELKAKIDRRAALYDQAIAFIAQLIMGNNRKITIFPLLDNDNENVQDAQWTIVGDDYVIVLNKFYWL